MSSLGITDNPVRSRLDRRSYLLEELPNKLRVQWVHCPGAQNSKMVVSLASGSYNDDDVPGVGHAAEHFLFMGSKKYPRRDILVELLAKNSGSRNGGTQATSTTWWFEINTDAADEEAGAKLEEVGDVFLQHFIEPIFDPDTVERELKNIESEYRCHERDDMRRLWQLDQSLSNPEHPASWTFAHGNRESLGEPAQLLANVAEHWKKHYCAGLMGCVVLSPLPIEELQDRFRATLAEIPNRGLSRKDWGTIPNFLEKDLGTETFIEPVGDVDFLIINFHFPGKEDDGYSARGEHALDLLSQKAEGGVYDVLKGKGLVQDLSGGVYYEFTGHRRIFIVARLTESGAENYQKVVQEIYYMIARIKAEGPQQGRVEEETRSKHIRFCTRQIPDMKLASRIAKNMLRPYLQPENLVYGSNEISVRSRFNADDIIRNMDLLKPENMRLVLVSNKFKNHVTEKEKWFGTEWGTRKIPPDDMASYRAAATLSLDQLHSEPKLPPPNSLIIKHEFEIELLGPQRGWAAKSLGTADEKEEKRRPPPRALQTGKNEIWFAQGEGVWAEPRVMLDMRIQPNNIFADAESCEKTDMFRESFNRAMAGLFEKYTKSGMSCSVSNERDSLIISATGFKNVLQPMLIEFLSALRHHQLTEADFDIIKTDFFKIYQNERVRNPSHHSGRHLNLLTSDHAFSSKQTEAALQTATFDNWREWGAGIFNTSHFQCLISGDITQAAAMDLWPVCQEQLKLSWHHEEEPPRRRARLPPSGRISLLKKVMVDPENKNSYVDAVMFFAASRQAEHIAAPTLLVQILKGKAFDRLRTEHGLGYRVGMKLELGPQQSAVKIGVECPQHSCLEAARVMLNFVKEAPSILEQLSPKELERYRDSSEQMVEALQNIAKDQLVGLAKRMDPSSPESTQLWLFMEAKKRETAEENPDYINLFPAIREVAFVKGMSDFPDLSTPEEVEENLEDFLVEPKDLCRGDKSVMVC
ncbi:peptidase M16 inactive domain-containing [Fusarium albosuccineum]|uniref:Peptidase M16 inactive domain-containing n=1 Tax=Fusarium albosuccineum TaxID=1237068 RepID=A0A8H4LEY2_9HYPO|nr:peptidase M16 inactive domain-containing [Fusarium albosuccineum]